MHVYKELYEHQDDEAKSRLAAIKAGYSARMGGDSARRPLP
ncbi:MAG TPA: hypothetical protein VIS57_09495 [Xanthomonadales bacterium]